MVGAWRIALFFTGAKHAGENIAAVLKRRAGELPPPIQMRNARNRVRCLVAQRTQEYRNPAG